MTRKAVACGLVVFSVVLGGLSTRNVVTVDVDTRVVVLRAPGDGLEGMARSAVSFGVPEALAACSPWDVRETCCPAGCAAKNGPNWPKADEILRGCMRALGCGEDEVRSATVFIRCGCEKKQ